MNLKKNYEYYLLFIISLIYFTFLYYRNSNLFPSVMGDEFVHSTYARHYKFHEMQIPTYLYYWIFSLTKYYSVEYFNCARIINSFFFLLGNLLIYLMSKKYLSTWQSILLFSLVLFSPLNVFTAYFTPEATYFFFIWLFIFCYSNLDKSKYLNNLYLGVLLGVSALIKPHALILLFGLIINNYIQKTNAKNFTLNLLILILSFLVIKTLPSILFSGKSNFIGFYYLNSFSKYISNDIFDIATKSLINFFGIFSFLIILFGLPIILCLEKLINYSIFKKHDELTDLSIFSFIIFFTTIIVISINHGFAVNFLEDQISYENPRRLNIRYFYFYFPLFFLLGFIFYNSQKKLQEIKISILFKIFIVSFIFITIYFYFNKYPSYHLVDGPLYRGITYNIYFFTFMISILIIIFLISIKNLNLSFKTYLYIYLPFILLITSLPTTKELLHYKSPTTSDEYGNLIKKKIDNKKINHLILIHFDPNIINDIDDFKILLKLDRKEVYAIKPKDLNFKIPKENIEQKLINIIQNEPWYWHYKNHTKFDLYIIIKNEVKSKKIYIFDPKTKLFDEIL